MPLQTAHRQEEARRARPRSLLAGTPPIRLASAEDTIVAKLKWYQAMGGSKRQWADILGVIVNQQSRLDLAYLRQWADTLGVRAELEQVLTDAQLGPQGQP